MISTRYAFTLFSRARSPARAASLLVSRGILNGPPAPGLRHAHPAAHIARRSASAGPTDFSPLEQPLARCSAHRSFADRLHVRVRQPGDVLPGHLQGGHRRGITLVRMQPPLEFKTVHVVMSHRYGLVARGGDEGVVLPCTKTVTLRQEGSVGARLARATPPPPPCRPVDHARHDLPAVILVLVGHVRPVSVRLRAEAHVHRQHRVTSERRASQTPPPPSPRSAPGNRTETR